jgi:hypothetical protein
MSMVLTNKPIRSIHEGQIIIDVYQSTLALDKVKNESSFFEVRGSVSSVKQAHGQDN